MSRLTLRLSSWVNLMTEKLNLVLMFGGRSGEHEVSLMSARSVLEALSPEKYQVFQLGITKDGLWKTGPDALSAFEEGRWDELEDALLLPAGDKARLCLRTGSQLQPVGDIDVVFPVIHGTFGEDGTMQGLFEIYRVAYVGAGVLASALAMDKAICKRIAASAGIPVLEYAVFTRNQIEQNPAALAAQAEQIAFYPLFVKPANLGSSVGISKAHNRAELEAALLKAARYDRRILVERGIEAREIEISVLGNENPLVSFPGEIVPGDEFYTYQDKYHHGDPETAIPAPLSPAQTEELRGYALQAYQSVDCAGMARVDFLIEKASGKAYFNEINTIPGFTSISMYAKLLKYSGVEYNALVDRLIALALERKADQEKTVRKFED